MLKDLYNDLTYNDLDIWSRSQVSFKIRKNAFSFCMFLTISRTLCTLQLSNFDQKVDRLWKGISNDMMYNDLDVSTRSQHAFNFCKKNQFSHLFHKISGSIKSKVVQLGPKDSLYIVWHMVTLTEGQGHSVYWFLKIKEITHISDIIYCRVIKFDHKVACGETFKVKVTWHLPKVRVTSIFVLYD